MQKNLKKLTWLPTAAAFMAVFAIPHNSFAQTASASGHLVSPSALTQAATEASHQRQQNIDTLNQALSSSQAQRAIEAAHMNPQQVKDAVAGLSSQELAQLASRADTAQSNFAAGNIDNHDLLIILVGIAALILIIVAVH